jgi:hypothetical protein
MKLEAARPLDEINAAWRRPEVAAVPCMGGATEGFRAYEIREKRRINDGRN